MQWIRIKFKCIYYFRLEFIKDYGGLCGERR